MTFHDRRRTPATLAVGLVIVLLGGGVARAQNGPLGLPAATTEFILGDSYQHNTDNYGAVAIGGNAFFTSYAVDNNGGALNGLVVGKNLTGFSSTLNGNVIAGGLATYSNPTINGNFSGANGIALNPNGNQGGTISGQAILPSGQPFSNNGVTIHGVNNPQHGTTGAVTVPINFSSEGSLLKQISAAQVAASDYSVTPIFTNQLHFDLSHYTPQLGHSYFFDVTAADFSRSGTGIYIDATGVPADATVVVNIIGTTVGGGPSSYDLTGIGTSHVLYNFSQATSVTLGSGVNGTILAPNAAVFFDSGNINGQLIAGSFGSTTDYAGVEIHYSLFEGHLRAVPEPASLALMGAGGLGLLGYAWRRRRAGCAARS
jgi:choice-of-anchor A domain-containing protein